MNTRRSSTAGARRRRPARAIARSVTLVGAVLAARPAAANCARPIGYDTRITEAGAVVITPVSFDGRGCSPSEVLLRQDVGSGEIVRIDTCAPAAGAGEARAAAVDGGEGEVAHVDEARAFIDPCVKPGTYRYGFERPFECSHAACSTSYFDEVKVTTAPSAACVAPLRAKVARVPWGASPTICTYGGGFVKFGLLVLVVSLVVVVAAAYGVYRLVRRARRAR